MSATVIRKTANQGVQLSQNKFYWIANKFRIGKGNNVGQPLFVLAASKLISDYDRSKAAQFEEIEKFLLSKQQFEEYLAMLIELSERKLEDAPEG
jgi:hypothetical protein